MRLPRWSVRPVAGVMLAAGLLASCEGPRPGRAPVAAPRPLAPEGEVDLPVAFTWTGPPPDAVVRITVADTAERRLAVFDARGPIAQPPPELTRQLRAGESYQWRLALVDADNEAVQESSYVRFRVR